MRTLILMTLILFTACKQKAEKPKPEEQASEQNVGYPQSLQQVFEAHGGLDLWRQFRTLKYRMGEEIHTTDLVSRLDRIDHPDYSYGNDSQGVWKTPGFKKDPVFYHNLMFYFYAMPFILSDPGINYEPATPLEFQNITYPGIRITYQDGIGVSPDDEYFLHYHPETHRMEWLGYTVTYGKEGPSEEVHWIRYAEWQRVAGVLLPQTLQWFHYENGRPTEPRNAVTFDEVALSPSAKPEAFYQRP